MAGFDETSTADQVLEGIDLSGRTAIVTGASGGLGAETARALASKGCAVTLAARNRERAEAVAKSIREETGAQVDIGELELADPASVRIFAERWKAEHGELNLLILNAGIMACPLSRTKEGFELQFATNHLGHFLLSALLVDRLRAGAPSRLVSLSSGGHVASPVVFEDIHFESREYTPFLGYGQAKTANVLFAVEFDRRFKDADIRAYGVHPGMIHTDLGRHLTPEIIKDIVGKASSGGEPRKDVPQGAATSCWAATSPDLEGKGGIYLADCQIAPPKDEGNRGVAAHAVDPEAAAQLWKVSEDLLGVEFR
jgi:NAD(P)-dependent dehydrogenase (short-subunit alcohol dehydrogenase family)